MIKIKITARVIARTGIIAAVYASFTLMLSGLSFGPVQVRVSEALALLPMIFPEAVLGLFLGCFIANLMGSPLGAVDIVFGSLTTLVAAYLTYRFRFTPIAYASPIVLNAFIVSLYLYAFFQIPYWITVLYIGVGQSIAVLGLGIPLLKHLKSRHLHL